MSCLHTTPAKCIPAGFYFTSRTSLYQHFSKTIYAAKGQEKDCGSAGGRGQENLKIEKQEKKKSKNKEVEGPAT